MSRRHRVKRFEKEARLGGHTNTILIPTRTAASRSLPASWCTRQTLGDFLESRRFGASAIWSASLRRDPMVSGAHVDSQGVRRSDRDVTIAFRQKTPHSSHVLALLQGKMLEIAYNGADVAAKKDALITAFKAAAARL